MKKEGWTGVAIVVLTPIQFIIILIYFIFPTFLSWLSVFIVPELVRWIGLIVIILATALAANVHSVLGRSYSYALETKSEQSLITIGPFKRVRHPLYSAHTLLNIGMICLTMNIPLTVFAIIGVFVTYTRIRDEERMLIEKFGSEYEEYMKSTGRIFPKF
jgi:protein-S-isoprenylcysteine O-methyltransferase Ste14